jgi:hypothetical protein
MTDNPPEDALVVNAGAAGAVFAHRVLALER